MYNNKHLMYLKLMLLQFANKSAHFFEEHEDRDQIITFSLLHFAYKY